MFSIAIAAACGLAQAQTAGNDYYQARSGERNADLLTAVEKYHEHIGMEELRGRRFAAAWGDFDFMLRHFPNHPRALMLMGDLCQVWRDTRCNMEAYFDKAIQLSPESAGIYLTKGVYLQKRGKLNEAIESYKKSLELDPSSANAHYNIGLAYVATKQYTLANEHAQQAYAAGLSFPGLQTKLVAAKAWKPLAPKPATESATAVAADPAQAGKAAADEPKPRPTDAETKSNDVSK